MAECELRFSPCSRVDAGTYKLIELPPDLCKLVEGSTNGDDTPIFTIKGASEEDAVLCTAHRTYAVRSVVLSNTMGVVTADPTPREEADEVEDDDACQEVFIRDQLHEIIELVPCVPRLHKLNSLLRGQEYDEGHEDEDINMSGGENDAFGGVRRKGRGLTYDDARMTIQASESELRKGLRDRRVLVLDDQLRPIAPSHLTTILELLLTNLVSRSVSYTAAPVEDLVLCLDEDHDINRKVTREVMSWFGHINEDGNWSMNVEGVIREVGLGILRSYREEPILEMEFLGQWKRAVGDTFEDKVAISLLSGNYLTSFDTLVDPPASLFTYFPAAALPIEHGPRFAELFLARPRWRGDEIAPFLVDVSVDSKERDRLLLKYARAVTDADGIWYTSRTKHAG